MSLENGYSNLFRKQSTDAVSSCQSFYPNKDLQESDYLSNMLICESHLSSQMSETSKSSLEIDGVRFSQEIENILSKHLKQSSIVEKNVKNTYSGILDGLKNSSLGKISEVSYEESQKENRKDSKQASVLESQTILSDMSKKVEGKVKKPINAIQNSLRGSTFALTNRIFCMKCCTEVFTEVNYQMKTMSVWGSIGFFLEAIKCCGEPRMMSRYQELVHTCKNCGTIVARISTN
jgi:hypothetical protein